ncbi:hypothetical protein E1292_38055 [Nonomuraea deserti]|uniref:Uncharacterized protein n=1 Tax=Nonomuraea deserti TaxID=1848322 RepID=A0A4R4VAX9_9ACTN|nr:hypothetical protein [Nonomuraea deserti]TDC96649.1 hypothetical protein E1292_38055 [Nonomuraea deserti]
MAHHFPSWYDVSSECRLPPRTGLNPDPSEDHFFTPDDVCRGAIQRFDVLRACLGRLAYPA